MNPVFLTHMVQEHIDDLRARAEVRRQVRILRRSRRRHED